MKQYVDALVREALSDAIDGGVLRAPSVPVFTVDAPRHAAFGDVACDVALVLARELGECPHAIANMVAERLRDQHGWIAGIEVGGPGFVNFRFAPPFWQALLRDALAANGGYGQTDGGRGRRIRVVCGRAAPGTPESLIDGRAAAVADAAARLLEAAGFDVERAGDGRGGGAGHDVDEVVGVGTDGGLLARLGTSAPGARRRVLGVHPVRVTRDGEPLREPISFHAVTDEIGHDAARYLLVLERADRPVELDLELAKVQGTDNPVFYAQYGHARLAGVLRQTRPAAPSADLSLLGEPEREPLRAVASYPDVLEAATRALEPDRVARYAVELAAVVHRWLNRHRIITPDPALTEARLALAGCLRQLLGRALTLCGVSAPEQM